MKKLRLKGGDRMARKAVSLPAIDHRGPAGFRVAGHPCQGRHHLHIFELDVAGRHFLGRRGTVCGDPRDHEGQDYRALHALFSSACCRIDQVDSAPPSKTVATLAVAINGKI
ncbi:MAG: hypothetical protein M9905_18455 [Rhizobiaceae bacterium]|nr:hypothetical protein [Rhizobiaceae bacterium]